MKRRVALKNVALTVGALVGLPAWANGWTKTSVFSKSSYFSPENDLILAEIVETIIPTTDTPGAKPLGVHQFIKKVVTDCYEKPAQETLQKGIGITDDLAKKTYNKSFVDCDTSQRLEVLKSMSGATDKDTKGFFSMVKGMTIWGYLNSEYVMTNLTHFEMVPSRFHGCVPVKNLKSTN